MLGSREFLFQTGSIKSLEPLYQNRQDFQSFYSKLVRLKVGRFNVHKENKRLSFYSKLVRLKVCVSVATVLL